MVVMGVEFAEEGVTVVQTGVEDMSLLTGHWVMGTVHEVAESVVDGGVVVLSEVLGQVHSGQVGALEVVGLEGLLA